MSFIKSAIAFAFIAAVSFNASANESKFDTCIKATILATQNYAAKEEGSKIRYSKATDLVVGLLYKQAAEIGYYKATSYENAAMLAFAKCSESPLWSE